MKKKLFPALTLGLVLILGSVSHARTVIAIDAGHGGKDPGTMGKVLRVKEKDVTLSIARELKALLDADPNFKAVMTRNGDYYIQLSKRTEIARKHRANYLISIHADSSPISGNVKGASVWVLSNSRASDELGKWLEDHEKQSELLGGVSEVLANAEERYLSQTVLDLQFTHSRRSSYELGQIILRQLSRVTTLINAVPKHASLSVLRSPDIPSILIETGFLSTPSEEQKLADKRYHRKLARAIYQGLVEYRKRTQLLTKGTSKSSVNTTKTNGTHQRSNTSSQAERHNPPTQAIHIVKANETLYSIARHYQTTPDKLRELNKLKDNKILVGQKLKLK